MRFAPDTFDVDKIGFVLYRCMDKIRTNPNGVPMSFGLSNGSEKTGCLIGLENDTVCIQEYARMGENGFSENDRIAFFSIESIVTFQIHNASVPEIFGIFWKNRKTGTFVSKLATRRDFAKMLAGVTGSENITVEILWDTFDIDDAEIAVRFVEFLAAAEAAIRSVCSDDMGKRAWADKVRRLSLEGAERTGVEWQQTEDSSVLAFSFCHSRIREKANFDDVTKALEQGLNRAL